MRVVSVNVGTPREIPWRGRSLVTAIVKEPVPGPVQVGRLGMRGDAQADARVHGGPDKAVYLYPAEHYPFWEGVLAPGLPWGAFGENLTTRGLLESGLSIGDRIAVGSALLEVAEPRLPCVKLAARHGCAELPERFARAGRPGVYLRVVEEGEVAAGGAVTLRARASEWWPVDRVASLLLGQTDARESALDRAAAARLAGYPRLGESPRRSLAERTGFAGVVDGARAEDIPTLHRLLADAGLPVEPPPARTSVVLAARDPAGSVIGGVALETEAASALLRSLVVAPAAQGSGVGGALVAAALASAWGRGATNVSLLTDTAPAWFARFGFRAGAEVPPGGPAPLAAAEGVRGSCPASAVLMVREAPASTPARSAPPPPPPG
ncbi:MAG: GNAT family N-acetyltransferase [Longimicrobiales bacterium]|nr:GNAT family N-acetyltransferase [Longimicrobiales bacterium]